MKPAINSNWSVGINSKKSQTHF